MKTNIAILASGSGSNAENIIHYFEKSDLIKISLVISNKKNAYVLERARRLNVLSAIVPKSNWETGATVMTLLQHHQIDFIVLAGFLLRVPDMLLRAYP
ncbi:Phosphoribosylglycinamide formyltransferase, partial [termite gut metagenome]